MTEVMQAFGRLIGKALVLDLPVDEVGLKAWISRQKSGDTLQAARAWASNYRARHREHTNT
jgi:hypothetical protein